MTDAPMVAAQVIASRVPAPVRVSYPQEFVAELHRDKAGVHRGLVRLTYEHHLTPSAPYQQLVVVAGYLVRTGGGQWQLIELHHPCGRIRGLGSETEVNECAQRMYASVEQAIADAGLECRPGRLVAPRPERCAAGLGAEEEARERDIAERRLPAIPTTERRGEASQNGDPRYYTLGYEPDDHHDDLQVSIRRGEIVPVADEAAGIIAYALHISHAEKIAAALNSSEETTDRRAAELLGEAIRLADPLARGCDGSDSTSVAACALEEVGRLVSEGNTSGSNRNDTGRFDFAISDEQEVDEDAADEVANLATVPGASEPPRSARESYTATISECLPFQWRATLDNKPVAGVFRSSDEAFAAIVQAMRERYHLIPAEEAEQRPQ